MIEGGLVRRTQSVCLMLFIIYCNETTQKGGGVRSFSHIQKDNMYRTPCMQSSSICKASKRVYVSVALYVEQGTLIVKGRMR